MALPVALSASVLAAPTERARENSLVSFEATPYTDMGHVFCIGANKAGTTSLWEWFNAIPGNWSACHNECEGGTMWSTLSREHPEQVATSPVFTQHRAFMDNGDSSNWEFLYKTFQNGRFVLNARALMPWVLSRYDMIKTIRKGGGCPETSTTEGTAGTDPTCPKGSYGIKGAPDYYESSWTANSDADIRSWITELATDQEQQLAFFDQDDEHRNRFVMIDISEEGTNPVSRLHWILRTDLKMDRTHELLTADEKLPSNKEGNKYVNRYTDASQFPGPSVLNDALASPQAHSSESMDHVGKVLTEAGCPQEYWNDLTYQRCAKGIKASKLKLVELPKTGFPSVSGDVIPLMMQKEQQAVKHGQHAKP